MGWKMVCEALNVWKNFYEREKIIKNKSNILVFIKDAYLQVLFVNANIFQKEFAIRPDSS